MLRCVHDLGILHGAGAAHDEAGGDRERDVVIAVLEVELARADVGQGIPAVHVVYDDEPGRPTRAFLRACADVAHVPGAVTAGPESRRCTLSHPARADTTRRRLRRGTPG